MASEPEFSPQLRLHSLSWLFVLTGWIKQFIVPLIALAVFNARDDGSLWGVAFVVPLAIGAVWRQFLYRYGFGPRGLVIRDGLLFRNVRQIEYSRIENVDTERGLLHRLLNVVEVRVETSSGGKPEAKISVLSLEAADQLRERIFSDRRGDRVQPKLEAEGEKLLQLSAPELMRYGFVDNRGMLVVAALFGVLSQGGSTEYIGQFLKPVFDDATVSNPETVGVSLVMVGVGLLAALFLFVRLLSLVWALVTLHDFTLMRQGDDLRIRYGLLTSIALTLRLPRIQAVHQSETFMHRFFGRVTLSVDLAGDGGQQTDENGQPQTRMRLLAPICTPRRANGLIGIALPMLVGDSPPQWQPLAPGAQMRILRRTVMWLTLICAGPGIYLLGFEAPALWLAIVPFAWLHAKLYVQHTRWALTREALLFRSGWWTRRLSIVPRNRVQVVQTSATPFDRRKRMATVVVDTAGASVMSSGMKIPYLTREVADDLAATLYRSAHDSIRARNRAQIPPPDLVETPISG